MILYQVGGQGQAAPSRPGIKGLKAAQSAAQIICSLQGNARGRASCCSWWGGSSRNLGSGKETVIILYIMHTCFLLILANFFQVLVYLDFYDDSKKENSQETKAPPSPSLPAAKRRAWWLGRGTEAAPRAPQRAT